MIIVEMTMKTYYRTETGASWKSNPDKVETAFLSESWAKEITSDNEARFWNVFGTCRRAYSSGTPATGRVVTTMTRVNPTKDKKVVETYRYIVTSGGYRESFALENARRAEPYEDNGHTLAKFQYEDGDGDGHFVIYDATNNCFVG